MCRWGIWRAGGVAVPLCLTYPPASLDYVISDTGADVIVASARYSAIIKPLAEARQIRFIELEQPDDYDAVTLPELESSRKAMILYTSGTTSLPKGVVTTHANLDAQINSLVTAWEWQPTDHILCVLPLHHVHGIVNVIGCALWAGACCEFLPEFSAAGIFDAFQRGSLNLFMAVPTIYFKLIAHWESLPAPEQEALTAVMKTFRLMVSGSAALPVTVMEKWERISGQVLLERYGITEIGMAISNPYRDTRVPGHIGQPLAGVGIRLVDDSDQPAADGLSGGMYGIMWTDAVQGILMFAVALLMLAIPFMYVGGYDVLIAKIAHVDHVSKKGTPIGNGLVTFGQLTSFLYIVGIGLSVGMKQISEPKLLIRFYTVKDRKGMKFAMTWTPIFMGVSLVCVMGLGALVHAMVTTEEAAYLVNNIDEVVGFMLKKFNSPLVSGICLMGLFAAGMAALASVTLVVGTTLVKDIWNVWRPMPAERIIPRTKLVMFLYCLLVYYFTLFPPAEVVKLSAFAGSVYVASFLPTIFGGLYFRRGTDLGAVASMVTGIVVNIIWRFGVRPNYAFLADVHEVFPAFIASFVVYGIASLLTANRRPEPQHLGVVFGTEKPALRTTG